MEIKVMWAGAVLFGGWLAYYLFGRQFFFNFRTAFPLIAKMTEANAELISPNSRRYTVISAVSTGLIFALISFAVLRFCPLYLKVCYTAGVVVCAVMYLNRLSPENRDMFDSFCATYYRFVPDDELRTDMYNKKPSQMKVRLHEMAVSSAWIPEFKK